MVNIKSAVYNKSTLEMIQLLSFPMLHGAFPIMKYDKLLFQTQIYTTHPKRYNRSKLTLTRNVDDSQKGS